MKISADTIAEWTTKIENTLTAYGYSFDDIQTGSDAWQAAHKSGIIKDIYIKDAHITDAHIKTALSKIFPKAVFKDKYNY